MHKNILKNVKSALIVLLTLVCLSFAFANKTNAQATGIASKTIEVNGKSYTVRVLESNKDRDVSGEKSLSYYLGCRQERMDDIYKSACYPCKVVKSLISVFLNGCKFLENVSREAGQKILIIGFMLWIVFYVMKQISSFKNIEPASMINDLLIMAFKIMFAWLVITRGFSLFVDYLLVPFLGWGIDFGTELLIGATTATGLDISGTQVDSSYMLGPDYDGILPPHILNNLMTYIAAVDGTVTNHLKIGHMVTCHARTVAVWHIWGFSIVNIWIWLCGAAIWIAGLVMTISVLFYLVDMSFKLGFALVALPIVMGLWPFDLTKGKATACFQVILNATGIFVFLAMTTACGLVLVDSAIAASLGAKGDTITNALSRAEGAENLFRAIEAGDTSLVASMFSLFGSGFFIILFAYLYAIKIIGSTLTDYVDPFFKDGMLGKSSPMHHRLTQAMAYTKRQLVDKPVGYMKDVAKFQGKKFLNRFAEGNNEEDGEEKDNGIMAKWENINKKLDNWSKGKFGEEENTKKESGADTAMSVTNMKAKDGEEMDKAAGAKGGKDDGSNAATQALEAAGEGLEKTGQAIKDAANAVQQTGKAVDAAGTAGAVVSFGTTKVASTAARVGTETSATATKAGAEALIMTGKVLKKTAKELKKFNKMAKKVQKITKKATKAAKKVQKTAQKLTGGGDENKENKENQNPVKNITEGSDKQQMRENEGQDDFISSMASVAAGNDKNNK